MEPAVQHRPVLLYWSSGWSFSKGHIQYTETKWVGGVVELLVDLASGSCCQFPFRTCQTPTVVYQHRAINI